MDLHRVVVPHRGGINGRLGKVNMVILPEDGSTEDAGSGVPSVCNGVCSMIARADCDPGLLLGVLVMSPVF
jgi:hypothetical protein